MLWLVNVKVNGAHEAVTVEVEADTPGEAIELTRAGLGDDQLVSSVRRPAD